MLRSTPLRIAMATALVGMSLLLGACQGQMRDQIDYRPQESPMPVPADQVAMSDQEVNLNYALGETGGPTNPTLGNVAATLALGKEKFEAQCGACHGLDGKGDGLVGKALTVPPADLTNARFKTMSDGQMYLRIVDGGAAMGALMPSYTKKLTIAERWAVVNYVKADIAGKP